MSVVSGVRFETRYERVAWFVTFITGARPFGALSVVLLGLSPYCATGLSLRTCLVIAGRLLWRGHLHRSVQLFHTTMGDQPSDMNPMLAGDCSSRNADTTAAAGMGVASEDDSRVLHLLRGLTALDRTCERR